MHRNVLCVVNISNPAQSGVLLQRASAIAAVDQAQLHVLSVAPDLTGGIAGSFLSSGPMKELFGQATRMTQDFVQQTAPGIKVAKSMTALGDLAEEAVKAAEEAQADLIVLGPDREDLCLVLASAAPPLTVKPSIYLVRN